MDKPTLKQIYDQKQVKNLEAQKHQELLAGSVQLSNTVIDSTMALIKYLEGSTSKVEVTNQLQSIGTPDALKVVSSVNALHATLRTHKNTDLSEITSVMQKAVTELEKLPKEHAEVPKEQQIDYTPQFKALTEAIKTVDEAIKAQDLNVEAPIINVDKPDLSLIQKSMDNVIKAVKGIEIPKPESPYTKNGKSTKVELSGDSVPTVQTNILIDEKFDEYKLVYGDEFDDSSTNPSQIKYYWKKKKVTTLTLSYDKEGRLTGVKKS